MKYWIRKTGIPADQPFTKEMLFLYRDFLTADTPCYKSGMSDWGTIADYFPDWYVSVDVGCEPQAEGQLELKQAIRPASANIPMDKTSTKYLHRIDPMGLAKTFGLIGFIIGLIVGVMFFLAVGLLGVIALAFPIFILISIPIVYGVGGFTGGLILACLFNYVNGGPNGGIKLEFKEKDESDPEVKTNIPLE